MNNGNTELVRLVFSEALGIPIVQVTDELSYDSIQNGILYPIWP